MSLTPLTSERTTVGVLGGGAWGTAMAVHAARMGHDTLLWAREDDVVASINESHTNRFLEGHSLPASLRATGDIAACLAHSELVLMVIPTPFVAATMRGIAGQLDPSRHLLVSCTKGIETSTLETVDSILQRTLPEAMHPRLAYLSGPSFAAEVVQEAPTCVTVASKEETVAVRVSTMLSTPLFRCYRSNDVIGVEMGGALKNVLAIACGINDSLGYGNNGRAALITRGLNEMTKLAVARGGDPLTLAGLAGMGDLVLTCCGDLSRNRSVGLRLGKGETMEEINSSMTAVAEGVLTSKAAHDLAVKLDVECPIIAQMYRIIHEGKDPKASVMENMSRPIKSEVDPAVQAAWANRTSA